jgi:hypothetical protein
MNRSEMATDSVISGWGKKRAIDFVFPNQADRHRVPRVHVQIPMFVYGYVSGNAPFHEEARTIAIDARGGLICMQTIVEPGQRLFVVNEANEQTQECAVVFADMEMGSGIAVEIEFPLPVSQFWQDLEIGKTLHS